jgi:predicted nucleic acid-binding protein
VILETARSKGIAVVYTFNRDLARSQAARLLTD